MDEIAFAEIMSVLSAGCGREFSLQQMAVWFDCLKDLPLETLQGAVRRWLQENDSGFPSIGALRKLALGSDVQSRPLLAWDAFRRAWAANGAWATLDFDDPAINATVRMLGGLQRVGEIEGDQFYVWYRKEFERTYAALCESGVTEEMSRPLAGNLEALGQMEGCSGSDESSRVRITTGLPPVQRIGVEQKRIEAAP